MATTIEPPTLWGPDESQPDFAAPCEHFHRCDLAARKLIDRRALALERIAAFLVDEDPDADPGMLERAALQWQTTGRCDRAEFLLSLAAELRNRRGLPRPDPPVAPPRFSIDNLV